MATDTGYHDENTMQKVYDGLKEAGLDEDTAVSAVLRMQNRGIYFREAVPDFETNDVAHAAVAEPLPPGPTFTWYTDGPPNLPIESIEIDGTYYTADTFLNDWKIDPARRCVTLSLGIKRCVAVHYKDQT